MLDENEWAQIAPLMQLTLADPWRQPGSRGKTQRSEIFEKYYAAARAKYRELTGHDEPQVDVIWHHRLKVHGPPCPRCGRLLHSANEAYCSSCGASAGRPIPPAEGQADSGSVDQG